MLTPHFYDKSTISHPLIYLWNFFSVFFFLTPLDHVFQTITRIFLVPPWITDLALWNAQNFMVKSPWLHRAIGATHWGSVLNFDFFHGTCGDKQIITSQKRITTTDLFFLFFFFLTFFFSFSFLYVFFFFCFFSLSSYYYYYHRYCFSAYELMCLCHQSLHNNYRFKWI